MTASPGEVEWQCPFCDETETTLREIQQHITESTEEEHEGVSGDSPDEDIIAIDPESGDEIDRYERTDVVRPKDAPLQDVSKRKQVVYAWLANAREEDPDAFAAITDADRAYTVQILGQIRRGDISRDYWSDDMDRELLAALEERLETYEPDEDGDDTMSTQQQEPEQTEETKNVESVSDKEIIINSFNLLGSDINRKQVWEALTDAEIFSSGYEYFRREYKSAVDGDYSEEEIENTVDDQIQSVIEPVLAQHGVLAEPEEEESGTVEEPEESREPVEPASTTVEEPSVTSEGGVSVDDIRRVRGQIDLLHDESEALLDVDDSVGARRAEFIGSKTLELLDDLIEE